MSEHLDLRVDEFDRRYRFRMVEAYPVISGVPDVHAATPEQIDEGFGHVLANRHLRRTHELYLADRRAAAPTSTPRTSTCRSCGAGIVWAVTTKGKRMPVDLDPHPDGNVTTVPGGAWLNGRPALLAVVHPTGQTPLDADEPRYRSHFATCPQAEQHRRSR